MSSPRRMRWRLRRRSCRPRRRRSRPRRRRPRRSRVWSSSAAEEVSRNVQTVAAGAEQMGASIREIASNAAEACEVAARAVAAAETTTATVAKLGESSAEIGNVVKVITSHRRADQPAGAERDHRGGPGRRGGEGLRGRRQRGQGAGAGDGEGDRGHRPPGAGDPGRHGGGGRPRSSEISLDRRARSATARPPSPRAVEEQTATTNEMSRSVTEAAGGSTQIAENITGVSAAADSTTQALTQTRTAVDELSRMAADLRTAVGQVHLLTRLTPRPGRAASDIPAPPGPFSRAFRMFVRSREAPGQSSRVARHDFQPLRNRAGERPCLCALRPHGTAPGKDRHRRPPHHGNEHHVQSSQQRFEVRTSGARHWYRDRRHRHTIFALSAALCSDGGGDRHRDRRYPADRRSACPGVRPAGGGAAATVESASLRAPVGRQLAEHHRLAGPGRRWREGGRREDGDNVKNYRDGAKRLRGAVRHRPSQLDAQARRASR